MLIILYIALSINLLKNSKNKRLHETSPKSSPKNNKFFKM